MANLKSSKKDIIRSKRNYDRNKHYKSSMKTWIKKTKQAIEARSEDMTDIVRATLKLIDKLAQKGILHKNAAKRKKSQIASEYSTASKEAPKKAAKKPAAKKSGTKTEKKTEAKAEKASEAKTEKKATKKPAAKKSETKTEKKTEAKAEKKEEKADTAEA